MSPVSYDPTVLARLVGDDPVALEETLRLFQTVGSEWQEEVVRAIATADIPQLGELGHRMKSSARAIGAGALGDACAALERSAGAGEEATALMQAAHALAAMALVDAEITVRAPTQSSSASTPSGREK